jgi:hypothetical protein
MTIYQTEYGDFKSHDGSFQDVVSEAYQRNLDDEEGYAFIHMNTTCFDISYAEFQEAKKERKKIIRM